MKDWKNLTISPTASIRAVVEVINSGGLAQAALVVDNDNRLLGTVTDGDIRRGLLAGKTLESPVQEIMHREYRSVIPGTGKDTVWRMMRDTSIRQVPVVTEEGELRGLYILDELIRPEERPNKVVLMAGGRGTRLYPLTKDIPKPLLCVGEKPILETIISRFVDQGFHDIYLSVNYLGHKIQDHFSDGSAWGARIRYLEEDEELGTAGALTILPEVFSDPFIVMNGDVITSIDFGNLLDFHEEMEATATVCLRDYDIEVPFGVVGIENNRIKSIKEKPIYSVSVSAGVYVFEPHVLDIVDHNKHLDMPVLIESLITTGESICPFPIHEYWIDVGRIEEYESAHHELTIETD